MTELFARQIGQYNVKILERRFFIPVENEEEKTTIPITKRYLELKHRTGTVVSFGFNNRKGQKTFTDSRNTCKRLLTKNWWGEKEERMPEGPKTRSLYEHEMVNNLSNMLGNQAVAKLLIDSLCT